MRTFVSIELPEEVRSNLFHSFEKLENSGVILGRFTPKENLHLTLSFLGVLSNEEIELIKKKLSEVDFSSFEVEIGELGFFPNEEHINVIWVGLNSNKLDELHQVITDVLIETGILFDAQNFVPHVTLARVKSIKHLSEFFERLSELKIKKCSFLVDKFCLMKSELTSQGPVYKELESFSLREQI